MEQELWVRVRIRNLFEMLNISIRRKMSVRNIRIRAIKKFCGSFSCIFVNICCSKTYVSTVCLLTQVIHCLRVLIPLLNNVYLHIIFRASIPLNYTCLRNSSRLRLVATLISQQMILECNNETSLSPSAQLHRYTYFPKKKCYKRKIDVLVSFCFPIGGTRKFQQAPSLVVFLRLPFSVGILFAVCVCMSKNAEKWHRFVLLHVINSHPHTFLTPMW